MFFSKLTAMSIGTLWELRNKKKSTQLHTISHLACCPSCGKPWMNVEIGSPVVVLADPITNEAQQKLLENCLSAAGLPAQSPRFSLHRSCSIDIQNALLALQTQLTAQPMELIIVFGHSTARLMHPDFVPGQMHSFENTRLMVTHHPKDMLDHLALKAQVWADFCLAK